MNNDPIKCLIMFDFESGDIMITEKQQTFCYSSLEGKLLCKQINKLINKAFKKWKSSQNNDTSVKKEDIH